MFVGEEPGRGLIGRSVTGYHISRHRPRSATEAEQSRLGRQLISKTLNCFENRFEVVDDVVELQSADSGFIDRIHLRSMPFREANVAFHRIRNHENIGKEDGCIKTIATNGLERYLNGMVRRIAKVQETSCLRARFSILGKVSSGLPHQPDWRGLSVSPSKTLMIFRRLSPTLLFPIKNQR